MGTVADSGGNEQIEVAQLVFEFWNWEKNVGQNGELQPAADTACFGELEKALIHGSGTALDPGMIGSDVHATAAAGYLAARPPTLEIFPSWPMSHLQQPYSGNSQVGSTSGSSSGQNTIPQAELVSPLSTRVDSGHQQEALMVTVDDYNYGQGFGAIAGTAPIFQPHTAGQDKVIVTQRYHGVCAAVRDMPDQATASRARATQTTLTGTSECVITGAIMFDMEYARWLDDESKHLTELQDALQAQLIDANLGTIVEDCMRHYDELLHLRAVLARSDVFHLMTGMWATSTERCFLWMGGFRPSEILKMLIPQLDPLTDQQLLGMCNLRHSSEQAEEALVQGLQQLHQSLADAVGAGPLNDVAGVANYTGLMALALDRLDSLESFYRQHGMACHSDVGMGSCRRNFVVTENISPTGTGHAVHQQHQSQFSGL
ncbi:hypothetical protein PR202_gb01389 [Eleusine coracana subsp. coracana]|uniref:DOG1 domain-containing protein n=1 Tax=Eleusine coracana subsp. coracana TaxID=191504 RepID=A0AAV5DUA1_ELECO|nr:hypothetical protein PR202_gb01389 [Eleusine coracana subsp. coracana]